MNENLEKTVQLGHLYHRDKRRIRMDFPIDRELRICVDKLEGRRWSATNKCWYVDDIPGNLVRILEVFGGKARIEGKDLFNIREKQRPDKKAIQEENEIDELEMEEVILTDIFTEENEEEFDKGRESVVNKHGIECMVDEKFKREMKLRGKSPKTIETYSSLVNHFLRYNKGKNIKDIDAEEIKKYIMYKIDVLKFSKSYQNQLINALKRYFEYVYERMFEDFELPRPKRSKRLPKVISKEGVKELIDTIKNRKHKALISLIYSAGIRRQELLNLKIDDIDSKRMVINIRGAKGDKDRIVGLSPKVLEMLKEYYIEEKPKKYLFEGANGSQYSATSVQNIFKKAKSRAGIGISGGVHLLRHSFATHLHENGVDIRIIQEILGHKSLKTTELYTHVSRKAIKDIKSPFDDL